MQRRVCTKQIITMECADMDAVTENCMPYSRAKIRSAQRIPRKKNKQGIKKKEAKSGKPIEQVPSKKSSRNRKRKGSDLLVIDAMLVGDSNGGPTFHFQKGKWYGSSTNVRDPSSYH